MLLGIGKLLSNIHEAAALPASQCSSGACRQEFRRYVEKKEKIVQRTFSKLDVDNSGYIDADELVRWMHCCPLCPACHASELLVYNQWLATRNAHQYNGDAAEGGAG